jgi:hypothetical protein
MHPILDVQAHVVCVTARLEPIAQLPAAATLTCTLATARACRCRARTARPPWAQPRVAPGSPRHATLLHSESSCSDLHAAAMAQRETASAARAASAAALLADSVAAWNAAAFPHGGGGTLSEAAVAADLWRTLAAQGALKALVHILKAALERPLTRR